MSGTCERWVRSGSCPDEMGRQTPPHSSESGLSAGNLERTNRTDIWRKRADRVNEVNQPIWGIPKPQKKKLNKRHVGLCLLAELHLIRDEGARAVKEGIHDIVFN